jgi:putative two-component system response regulator
MLPYVPSGRGSVSAADRRSTHVILYAAAALGREEQPEVYRHVHPHGRATATLARSFAAVLQRDGDFTLEEIELGHLHDFGKYLISKSLLLKPGPLSRSEREVMSLHPVYGAQILRGLPGVTETIRLPVLYHHERWDGAGYPEGLRGTRIPPAARLVSVVDVYTSLRARRSYKPALTKREAAAEMEAMAGRELDPGLTSDFMKFVGRGSD